LGALQSVDDGQAKTGSTGHSTRSAPKRLENLRLRAFGQTRPMIAHR
jgi:hypothetical protein